VRSLPVSLSVYFISETTERISMKFCVHVYNKNTVRGIWFCFVPVQYVKQKLNLPAS
jgi:hypothetical protein